MKWIAFSEVLARLPGDSAPGQVDAFLADLDAEGVRILDDDPATPPRTAPSDYRFDDPVAVYLREVATVTLTAAQRRDLLEVLQRGGPELEKAQIRLMESQLGVVVEIAKRYKSPETHLLDAIQRGNNGLLRGVASYAGRRCRFKTWIGWWIRRAILVG